MTCRALSSPPGLYKGCFGEHTYCPHSTRGTMAPFKPKPRQPPMTKAELRAQGIQALAQVTTPIIKLPMKIRRQCGRCGDFNSVLVEPGQAVPAFKCSACGYPAGGNPRHLHGPRGVPFGRLVGGLVLLATATSYHRPGGRRMKCPANSPKPAPRSRTWLRAARYWDFVSRGLIPEEHKRIVQQSLNTRSASRPSTLSFPLIQDVMEGICKHYSRQDVGEQP